MRIFRGAPNEADSYRLIARLLEMPCKRKRPAGITSRSFDFLAANELVFKLRLELGSQRGLWHYTHLLVNKNAILKI
jgi:hypothetical protein